MTWIQFIIAGVGAVCVLAIFTTYALYPLAMALRSTFASRGWRKDETFLPDVTMVVAACNEEEVLEDKLRNFLSLDYPAGKLKLLIGNDGSTDGTQAILERGADGVRIRGFAFERGGKMKTVNRLVEHVDTPFIIFSDANTMYHPLAPRKLMRHFADSAIGGVCGKLILRRVNESAGGRGEHTYWSFENVLKNWEGKSATTLGATGGIYAIRSELYIDQPVHGHVADDFLLPMRILANGRRFVFDNEAIAVEDTMANLGSEFRRKIRVAVGTFSAMRLLKPLLGRLSPGVRVMLGAHKILRWLVPFFLIGALCATLLLASLPWVWNWVLPPVIVFCVLAAVAWIAELFGKKLGFLSLPLYFLAINAALLIGWYTFLFRSTEPTWERSSRGKG